MLQPSLAPLAKPQPGTPRPPLVAVFDSGVGGLSVLRALRQALPQADFVYLADNAWAPYGERDPLQVQARTLALVDWLWAWPGAGRKPQALVLACNTATAVAIDALRTRWHDRVVVGIEPALKPAAAASRTHRVGVLATRATLGSARFQALLARLHPLADFVCRSADGLAGAIERQDTIEIEALCARHTSALGCFGAQAGAIDTLVLGCTHYPFARAALQTLVGPDVQLIDPAAAVARHTLARLLPTVTPPQPDTSGMDGPAAPADACPGGSTQALGPPISPAPTGTVHWLSTGRAAVLHAAAAGWLGLSAQVQHAPL